MEVPTYSVQIALSASIHKANIPYGILNIDYPDMPFRHYAQMGILKNNPTLKDIARSLVNEYPDFKIVLKNNSAWEFLMTQRSIT